MTCCSRPATFVSATRGLLFGLPQVVDLLEAGEDAGSGGGARRSRRRPHGRALDPRVVSCGRSAPAPPRVGSAAERTDRDVRLRGEGRASARPRGRAAASPPARSGRPRSGSRGRGRDPVAGRPPRPGCWRGRRGPSRGRPGSPRSGPVDRLVRQPLLGDDRLRLEDVGDRGDARVIPLLGRPEVLLGLLQAGGLRLEERLRPLVAVVGLEDLKDDVVQVASWSKFASSRASFASSMSALRPPKSRRSQFSSALGP